MAMNTNILSTDSLQEQQQAQTDLQTTGLPSHTWQMLGNQVRTEPLPKDLDAMFDGLKGYLSRLKYRRGRYLARAKQVLTFDKVYTEMTDANLRAAALEFRAQFRTGRDS